MAENKNNWDGLKTKYGQAKTFSAGVAGQTVRFGKKIRDNKFYRIWTMAAMTGVLILLVYGGNLMFSKELITQGSYWVKTTVTGVALTLLFTSLIGFYGEKLKESNIFVKMTKQYSGQVFCSNNNQDKDTHRGVQEEVDFFNKKLSETIWSRKLLKVAGSFFGTNLNMLNEDFGEFFDLRDEDFEEFFKQKKYAPKRQFKIMTVVYKIRSFSYKIKGLITSDDLLYETSFNSKFVSPVFSERQETSRGIAYRFGTYMAISMLLGSIFIEGINVWSILTSIVTTSFSIVMTFIMADNQSKSIHQRRTNSLKKRICMLENSFNRVYLNVEIRAKFYIPVTREDGFEEVYSMEEMTPNDEWEKPTLEESFGRQEVIIE